ncbi:hypothetical protein DFJ74DRAFT_730718 [Hyaloraphidium curvatum]|nr:hypothetical protein DFJ74DRAFT_730718 [Hyaloraphidium curvatum]
MSPQITTDFPLPPTPPRPPSPAAPSSDSAAPPRLRLARLPTVLATLPSPSLITPPPPYSSFPGPAEISAGAARHGFSFAPAANVDAVEGGDPGAADYRRSAMLAIMGMPPLSVMLAPGEPRFRFAEEPRQQLRRDGGGGDGFVKGSWRDRPLPPVPEEGAGERMESGAGEPGRTSPPVPPPRDRTAEVAGGHPDGPAPPPQAHVQSHDRHGASLDPVAENWRFL